MAAGAAALALITAAPAPAEPVDDGCAVTWTGPTATVSKQGCIDKFLAEAHAENLTSRPSDGRSSDSQLVNDGLVACKYADADTSGDIDIVAAQVRRIDSTLSGGKPTFGGDEDTAAVAVVWIANRTLCP